MKQFLTLIIFLIMTFTAHAQTETNLLLNPSFESGKTSWTISSGSTATETTAKVHGTRSLVITASAQTPVLTQDVTTLAAASQFADGVQGLAKIRVRTNQSGVKVCSRSAGVTSTTLCVDVANNSQWGLYKVPFILGGTSNGISVAASSSITGNIYVDDAFVGMVDLKQDVDVVGPSISYTPSGAWVTNATYTGNYRRVGENMEVSAYVTTTGAPTATAFTVVLPSGFTIDTTKLVNATASRNPVGRAMMLDAGVQTYEGLVLYNSSNSVNIAVDIGGTISTAGHTNPFTWGAGDGVWLNFSVPILGWSAQSTTYTSTCGATCETSFEADITSGGVPTEQKVDWINGNCTVLAGAFTCPYVSTMGLTSKMSCSVSVHGSSRVMYESKSSSSTSQVVINQTGLTGTAVNDTSFTLKCSKTGSDYTTSTIMAASFNEVMTAPGITKPKTCYYGFGGAASTLAAPVVCSTGTCVEVVDTCGTVASPTFSSTGLYENITFSSGTFANSSPLHCDCVSFDTTSSNVNECNPIFYTSEQSWSSNSSGGAVISVLSTTTAGVARNGYVQIKCEGQAP